MQKASFRGKAMNKFEKDKRNCHPAGDNFFIIVALNTMSPILFSTYSILSAGISF